MKRLAQFDVTRQFATRRGKLAAQFVFALLCAAAMIGVRAAIDMWAPTSGPFALIYPTVLLVTLYGHWQAGLTAFVMTFLWAWYFVLPDVQALTFTDPTDPPRVAINAICCLIVIVFAEAFRRAARTSLDQIAQAADWRLVRLADVEHRTRNNFALVASMLEIQKRSLDDPRLHRHLDDAAGRVRTFADAYSQLDFDQSDQTSVPAKPYLEAVLDRIERAAVPGNVTLFREIDCLPLPRETVAAVGLYLNEAVSNALKYAFPGSVQGTVGVYFHANASRWKLTVEDNGKSASGKSVGEKGAAPAGKTAPGLGSKLMEAFARQAGAAHSAGPTATGYRVELTGSVAPVPPPASPPMAARPPSPWG